MSVFELSQIGLGVLQLLATLLIAWVLYRQAEKLKRVETLGHVQASFNVLNTIALESPETLKTFDSMGRPATNDTDETRRKRWCGFVWICALQEVYFSAQGRMIDKRYAEQTLRQQLEIILKDDLVYWILKNRGFDPGFVEFCTMIRRATAPDKLVIYGEQDAIKGVLPSVTQ